MTHDESQRLLAPARGAKLEPAANVLRVLLNLGAGRPDGRRSPPICEGSQMPIIDVDRDGVFTSWTLDTYRELFKDSPADDESTRSRAIDWIDVSGDSAVAKATLVHRPITFTDFFVLFKVEGEWRIANKVYHAASTARDA